MASTSNNQGDSSLRRTALPVLNLARKELWSKFHRHNILQPVHHLVMSAGLLDSDLENEPFDKIGNPVLGRLPEMLGQLRQLDKLLNTGFTTPTAVSGDIRPSFLDELLEPEFQLVNILWPGSSSGLEPSGAPVEVPFHLLEPVTSLSTVILAWIADSLSKRAQRSSCLINVTASASPEDGAIVLEFVSEPDKLPEDYLEGNPESSMSFLAAALDTWILHQAEEPGWPRASYENRRWKLVLPARETKDSGDGQPTPRSAES